MPKTHRTALVFDIRAGVDSEVSERFNRLLQSVNGPNIKVDTYVLRSNNGSDEIVPGTPATVDIPAPIASTVDVQQWASEQGYAQVLTAASAKV